MGDEWTPDPRVRRVELDDPLIVLLLMAVSYTHLDVYKRQVRCYGAFSDEEGDR